VGREVIIRQVAGKVLQGTLAAANAENLKLQQGSGDTKKTIYIFREGLSELSVVEKS
jgi:hypothetical protein